MNLIILTLATYRLAQIIAQDAISEPLRGWINKRTKQTLLVALGESMPEGLMVTRQWQVADGVMIEYWSGVGGKIAYGLHCVICMSVWSGLALAGLWWYVPLSHWLIYGLAASGGAVVLGSVLAAANRQRRGDNQ